MWFLELEHLMIFDVFDVFWKISAYTWVKKTVSGPPPAALGPPVPRNQRLLGRTPSPARPMPEGPEKPEPRAGGASTWIKDANGESVFLFQSLPILLPLKSFLILGIFYPALKQISLANSLQISGDNDLLGVYRNIFEEIISLDHQYGATLRKVTVTLWGISGWWVDDQWIKDDSIWRCCGFCGFALVEITVGIGISVCNIYDRNEESWGIMKNSRLRGRSARWYRTCVDKTNDRIQQTFFLIEVFGPE